MIHRFSKLLCLSPSTVWREGSWVVNAMVGPEKLAELDGTLREQLRSLQINGEFYA